MAKIKLTQNKFAIIDDEDLEIVGKFNWHTQRSDRRFYALRNVYVDGKRTTQTMHNFLVGKKGFFVDHIDSNGLNNQKCNLRLCTAQQNVYNSRMRLENKTGYKGVFLTKSRKFTSAVRYRGKLIYLGTFLTALQAARAYNKKAKELFGDFAKLNLV